MIDYSKIAEEKYFNDLPYTQKVSGVYPNEYLNSIKSIIEEHGDMFFEWKNCGSVYTQYITLNDEKQDQVNLIVTKNGDVIHQITFKLGGLKSNYMWHIIKYTKQTLKTIDGLGVWSEDYIKSDSENIPSKDELVKKIQGILGL